MYSYSSVSCVDGDLNQIFFDQWVYYTTVSSNYLQAEHKGSNTFDFTALQKCTVYGVYPAEHGTITIGNLFQKYNLNINNVFTNTAPYKVLFII